MAADEYTQDYNVCSLQKDGAAHARGKEHTKSETLDTICRRACPYPRRETIKSAHQNTVMWWCSGVPPSGDLQLFRAYRPQCSNSKIKQKSQKHPETRASACNIIFFSGRISRLYKERHTNMEDNCDVHWVHGAAPKKRTWLKWLSLHIDSTLIYSEYIDILYTSTSYDLFIFCFCVCGCVYVLFEREKQM